jgi:predicted transcriptional regulator
MELDCENVGKIVLPAMRRAVAKELTDRYNMKQDAIAALLDVKQASVSNYNRRFSSPRVAMVEKFLERSGVASRIAKMAASGVPKQRILAAMEGAIAEPLMMEIALELRDPNRRSGAKFGRK